jgi:hypothetical protein
MQKTIRAQSKCVTTPKFQFKFIVHYDNGRHGQSFSIFYLDDLKSDKNSYVERKVENDEIYWYKKVCLEKLFSSVGCAFYA